MCRVCAKSKCRGRPLLPAREMKGLRGVAEEEGMVKVMGGRSWKAEVKERKKVGGVDI